MPPFGGNMKLSDSIYDIIENNFNFDSDKLNEFYCYYLDTFDQTSEAPSKFILSVLLTALGSALSLSRWVEWGTKKIFPNFWIINLGESTRSRKTTSLDIGLHIIKKLNRENPKRDFILPSRASIASLLEVLKTEKNGVIQHSELATFLSLLKKGFNADMKALLTDFFDVPEQYKMNFITKDNSILERPIFSIATASTPIWMQENLKNGDSTSGFLARFLFAFQNKKTRSIAIPQQPDALRIKKIEGVFKHIYDLQPAVIELDEEFKDVYSEFYRESDNFIDEMPVDNGLKSIFSRLQTDYFLKFTILECVLSDKLTASRDEALRVKYLVAFFMAQAMAVIKSISPTETMALETKIQKFLSSEEEASRTDLYRYFQNNLSARKLNAALGSLMKAGVIIATKSTEKRNTQVFRLNSS
jgi:hypothetical protein